MSKLSDALLQAFGKVKIDSLFQNSNQPNMRDNPMAGGISRIGKIFQSDSVNNGPNGFQFDSIMQKGIGKDSANRTVKDASGIFGKNIDLPTDKITDAVNDSDLPDNG